MVHSVLLYGAEAWGCIRRMDSLDQLQMRALKIFFGVNKYHPRVSLLAEMGNLPLLWEAKLKCVVFWYKVLLSPTFENRIVRKAVEDAIWQGNGLWLKNLKHLLVQFGWSDLSGQVIKKVSLPEMKAMLSSIAWRRITDSWLIEMENRPKLSVLNTIYKSGCCNRCCDVPNKAHRTVLMKLRGGTAHFHIETGRWRGVPREERFCKECPSGDIEDIGHWLLHCDAWQASRVILFEKLQAHLSLDDFARLDDDQKTAVILDLACKIPSIMKAIMYMWTDRFCV
jgi:hypothetical protein